ncbi:hypothetical protein GEV33_010698 [Tenebrio molitor]|uniref:Reverse transcriptase domain-containing protein n=1 Tax=Tenebrio molitor TaxID=7067 RepID=A0A8J6LAC0_TENMO|nr:hypothetical protein GEV33_010698 [Tenebrio molitor]
MPVATKLREEGRRYKGGTDAMLGVLDRFSTSSRQRFTTDPATGAGEPVEENRSGLEIVQEELQPYVAADIGFLHEGHRPYASADHFRHPVGPASSPRIPPEDRTSHRTVPGRVTRVQEQLLSGKFHVIRPEVTSPETTRQLALGGEEGPRGPSEDTDGVIDQSRKRDSEDLPPAHSSRDSLWIPSLRPGLRDGDLLRRKNASRDGMNRFLWESFRRIRGIGQQNDTGPGRGPVVPGEPISSTDVHVPDDRRSRSRRPKSEAEKKTSWVSRCPQSAQPATHSVQLQVGAKRCKGGAEEDDNKKKHVEKMEAELKELIEKAATKKDVTRRKKIDRSRLLEAKRRYRERCKEKKKQRGQREEKEIKEIRTEREVWKYINRERKKKESVNEEITIQEWEEYFMKLLEGRKEEGEAGTQMKEKQTAPEETEITAEEVERQIRKLKKRKTPGREGVQNEAWMYGTERMVERMAELMAGGLERGRITLLNTGYKLYASVLSERSGTGQPSRVQKGKGHYGQLKKKEGRMCALFVDFRAAFDKKVREIYARTKSKVKMGEKKEGEWFETTKRVKQGCPLNLKRRGGVVVDRGLSLAFVDDMVIVAKSEREMMRNLGTHGIEIPGYIVREEYKTSKLRVKAGKRAAKFEDRMGGREQCRKLSECYREKKKDADAKERESENESMGMRCKTEAVAVYMGRERAKEMKMMARFRCENEERENSYLFHLQVQPLNHVYYQIQTWLGNNLEPQEWGWILQNDVLEPTTTLLPPAPEELCYRIFCKQERLWFELRM